MQKLPGYFKAILFIVAIYFGWHLLLLTRSILIPLIVAWLIAVVLLPLQLFLENKLHVPKGFAAFFCILVVLVFVGLFISFISGESSAFSADLTQLE